MATAEISDTSFKSPTRKLLKFFQRSRDKWKAKHHDVRQRLIKQEHQVRAVEKSRAKWRDKAEAAQLHNRELQQELAALKRNLPVR